MSKCRDCEYLYTNETMDGLYICANANSENFREFTGLCCEDNCKDCVASNYFSLTEQNTIDNSRINEEMQVELEADGYWDGQLVYDTGKCPNCGRDFEYDTSEWEEPYCCHCGQKLHWFNNIDEEVEDD